MDRAPAAEKELEVEADDLDGDMDFINDIQDEIEHEILFMFPDNLTAPLTFSLWEREVPFYEALQKLYKARNAKGVPKMGDILLLSVGIRRGWVRLMPLHLMMAQSTWIRSWSCHPRVCGCSWIPTLRDEVGSVCDQVLFWIRRGMR